MVGSVTPILGFKPDLSDAYAYWDALHQGPTGAQQYSPQLGTTIMGTDGHEYIFAKASGAVPAAATAVILTEPGMTFAAGAGAWQTVAANMAIGDVGWLKKIAIAS